MPRPFRLTALAVLSFVFTTITLLLPARAASCQAPPAAKVRALSVLGSWGGHKGSAVMLTSTHALTNFHVVEGSDAATVTQGPFKAEATVIGVLQAADLALLQLEAPYPQALAPLAVAAQTPTPGTALAFFSRMQKGKPRALTVRNPSFNLADPLGMAFFWGSFAGVFGDSGSGIFTCNGQLAGVMRALDADYTRVVKRHIDVDETTILTMGQKMRPGWAEETVEIYAEAQRDQGAIAHLAKRINEFFSQEEKRYLHAMAKGLARGEPKAERAYRAYQKGDGRSLMVRPEVVTSFVCAYAPQALARCTLKASFLPFPLSVSGLYPPVGRFQP